MAKSQYLYSSAGSLLAFVKAAAQTDAGEIGTQPGVLSPPLSPPACVGIAKALKTAPIFRPEEGKAVFLHLFRLYAALSFPHFQLSFQHPVGKRGKNSPVSQLMMRVFPMVSRFCTGLILRFQHLFRGKPLLFSIGSGAKQTDRLALVQTGPSKI